MILDLTGMNSLLEEIVALIDIPESYYRLAIDRYDSLGRWFEREKSVLVRFKPRIYPQGSFRYGTVIRPLLKREYYDLDLVCELAILKGEITQKRLKELVGVEVISYAEANNFNDSAEEKRRCWRLNYADDVSFHMDILPAIPDDQEFIRLLIRAGVPPELAQLAVAITDIDHPCYSIVDMDGPRSNPRGFGRWFEGRMQVVSLVRRRRLVEARAYATIDDVPVFEWKTPLQRSIQLFKRHRDVMFRDKPHLKPISMILTTLSASAYEGETDLYEAMTKILGRMLDFISDTKPRIPNPVNPAEDFADRWDDPRLEENFRIWHRRAVSDLASLSTLTGSRRDDLVRRSFDVNYHNNPPVPTGPTRPEIPPVHIAAPAVRISAPPRPWGK